MKTIGSKISDIEASLEVLKENTQKLQTNAKDQNAAPLNSAIEEQTRALERLKNLVEETSDRIQKIPVYLFLFFYFPFLNLCVKI